MKIDSDGVPFIVLGAVPASVAALSGRRGLAAALVVVPLAVAAFFRDPDRLPDGGLPLDPDLVLAHLHRVDFDRCLARHEAAARRRWSAADVEKGLGFQNRIVEPSAFAQWFHHDADRTNGPRQRVPACFQELL